MGSTAPPAMSVKEPEMVREMRRRCAGDSSSSRLAPRRCVSIESASRSTSAIGEPHAAPSLGEG
eukprot:2200043-Prymnesium_polylepis.1